jgi:hypothetical protein
MRDNPRLRLAETGTGLPFSLERIFYGIQLAESWGALCPVLSNFFRHFILLSVLVLVVV